MIKKYLLKPILYILILGFILIEEYAWNKAFKLVYLKVKDLKLMIKFKYYLIYQDNRYVLLTIFLLPFVLMEGFSILGVFLIGKGMIAAGIIIYLFKLLITIPVVIIFNSAKKKLVSFFIIKFGYFYILKFKRSKIFRNVKHKMHDFKLKVKEQWLSLKKEISIDNKISLKKLFKKVYFRIKNSKKEKI